MELVGPFKKVVDLAPLFVALRVDHDPSLGLIREVMADTGDGEDDLLQCTVLTYHLWGEGQWVWLNQSPMDSVYHTCLESMYIYIINQ